MHQQDITLRINGRQVDQFQKIGAPPNLDFFEHYEPFFRGQHRVVFRVGNQDIVNDVTLSGLSIDVRTRFAPPDIGDFVETEKRRIAHEQEVAGFQDRPKGAFYVSRERILASNRFPAFDQNGLAEEPDGPKFFVSHRWQTREHPDPAGDHLALLKDHARANKHAHYWVDYCCLPQARLVSDRKLFEKVFPKLVSIQAGASTIVIMDSAFNQRLWCYVEHFFGVLFTQTNIEGNSCRSIEYLGPSSNEPATMIEAVQDLREPRWSELRVTIEADIPLIKQNYRFLTNVVKFQLVDRFAELYQTLPGVELYTPTGHFPQSAFGLDYRASVDRIRALHGKFEWRKQNLFETGSIRRTAALLAQSSELDSYPIRDLEFSPFLIRSEEMVALLAVWLSVIQLANRGRSRIERMRTLYARVVAMSMLR